MYMCIHTFVRTCVHTSIPNDNVNTIFKRVDKSLDVTAVAVETREEATQRVCASFNITKWYYFGYCADILLLFLLLLPRLGCNLDLSGFFPLSGSLSDMCDMYQRIVAAYLQVVMHIHAYVRVCMYIFYIYNIVLRQMENPGIYVVCAYVHTCCVRICVVHTCVLDVYTANALLCVCVRAPLYPPSLLTNRSQLFGK